jgi:primosomal protein N''
MSTRAATAGKAVEAFRHDDAIRKNIPTAEHQAVLPEETQHPVRVAYERRNRDLDPQLVWRGKDEQDWGDLDSEIREARRSASAAVSLAEKLAAQKELKALEQRRSRKRRELYDAQDAIDAQRDDLIAKIERQLQQTHTLQPL